MHAAAGNAALVKPYQRIPTTWNPQPRKRGDAPVNPFRPSCNTAAATDALWEAVTYDDDIEGFQVESAKLLLAMTAGADPSDFDEGETILHCLSRQGRAWPDSAHAHETAAATARRVLAWYDVDVHARRLGGNQETALHRAAGCDEALPVMAALLAHGANVHAVDNNGWTPLFYATTAEAVRFLLAHIADPGAAGDHTRSTAHHLTAASAVRELLAHRVDHLTVGFDGTTPAHEFARQLCPAALREWLLYPGTAALADAPNAVGRTPLHVATAARVEEYELKRLAEAVRLLLTHGADPLAVDASGTSALDHAVNALKRAAAVRRKRSHGWEGWEYVDGTATIGVGNCGLRQVLQSRVRLVRLLRWHARRAALVGVVRMRAAVAAGGYWASAFA